MIFDHKVQVNASHERVWTFLNDIPQVATCLPGVEAVEPAGDDSYKGTLRVKVGPIGLALAGTIHFEARDGESGTAALRAEAADRKIGGSVRAVLGLRLEAVSPTQTIIHIHTDANLMGKIGEFGQSVIRKKADGILDEFAVNLRKRLEQ